MKYQRRFGSVASSREATQTRKLIVEIELIIHFLDSDIAAEEERADILDCSQPEYRTDARTLAARRDNLRSTIAALEKRLADLPTDSFEPA